MASFQGIHSQTPCWQLCFACRGFVARCFAAVCSLPCSRRLRASCGDSGAGGQAWPQGSRPLPCALSPDGTRLSLPAPTMPAQLSQHLPLPLLQLLCKPILGRAQWPHGAGRRHQKPSHATQSTCRALVALKQRCSCFFKLVDLVGPSPGNFPLHRRRARRQMGGLQATALAPQTPCSLDRVFHAALLTRQPWPSTMPQLQRQQQAEVGPLAAASQLALLPSTGWLAQNAAPAAVR